MAIPHRTGACIIRLGIVKESARTIEGHSFPDVTENCSQLRESLHFINGKNRWYYANYPSVNSSTGANGIVVPVPRKSYIGSGAGSELDKDAVDTSDYWEELVVKMAPAYTSIDYKNIPNTDSVPDVSTNPYKDIEWTSDEEEVTNNAESDAAAAQRFSDFENWENAHRPWNSNYVENDISYVAGVSEGWGGYQVCPRWKNEQSYKRPFPWAYESAVRGWIETSFIWPVYIGYQDGTSFRLRTSYDFSFQFTNCAKADVVYHDNNSKVGVKVEPWDEVIEYPSCTITGYTDYDNGTGGCGESSYFEPDGGTDEETGEPTGTTWWPFGVDTSYFETIHHEGEYTPIPPKKFERTGGRPSYKAKSTWRAFVRNLDSTGDTPDIVPWTNGVTITFKAVIRGIPNQQEVPPSAYSGAYFDPQFPFPSKTFYKSSAFEGIGIGHSGDRDGNQLSDIALGIPTVDENGTEGFSDTSGPNVTLGHLFGIRRYENVYEGAYNLSSVVATKTLTLHITNAGGYVFTGPDDRNGETGLVDITTVEGKITYLADFYVDSITHETLQNYA